MRPFGFRDAGRSAGAPPRRLSYANVTATLALVVALGGGSAWAAQRYLITSTKQIKPSVLRHLRGARGTNGANGTNGTNGINGTNGSNGTNGAVAGNSAINRALVPATIDGSATQDVTLQLPAGDYQVFGKIVVTGVDTVSGGSVAVDCGLFDTPTGGGAVAEAHAAWDDGLFVPGTSATFVGASTLPIQLAVNSPSAASAVRISCLTEAAHANGGTLTFDLIAGEITAVQTTANF